MPYKILVEVEGTNRGLLMRKFSTEATAEMEAKVKKTVRVEKPPDEEAEISAYRLEPINDQPKGQLVLPAEHFLGAIIGTGSGMKQKGKRGKTYKDAFKGCLDIDPDYIPLTNGDSTPLFDYTVDARPVRNPSTRGRIIRYRPHIPAGWRAKFTISVSDDAIPLEVAQAGLEESGRSKCVGDYRPRFGTYRVVSCEKE